MNLEEKVTGFYTEVLAQRLAGQGLRVLTQKDVGQLLGMERQRQLAGCTEASSCFAELAGALGAEAIVLGQAMRVGDKTQLELKVLKSSDGSLWSTFSARVHGEEAVLDELARAAVVLARDVNAKTGRASATVARQRGLGWLIPAGLGAALLTTGAIALGQSEQRYAALAPSAPISFQDAQVLRREGQTWQIVGVSGLISGGVAGATAVLLWLLHWKARARRAPRQPARGDPADRRRPRHLRADRPSADQPARLRVEQQAHPPASGSCRVDFVSADDAPLRPGLVRLKHLAGSFLFQALGGGRVRVEHRIHMDPGGALAPFVVEPSRERLGTEWVRRLAPRSG